MGKLFGLIPLVQAVVKLGQTIAENRRAARAERKAAKDAAKKCPSTPPKP